MRIPPVLTRPVQVLKGLVDAGMCGRKSGKGMFVYAEGTKDRPVNQVGISWKSILDFF